MKLEVFSITIITIYNFLKYNNLYVCMYFQKESSRGRHREKEDIKITKERTPESEDENVEWETNRDGEFKKKKVFFYIVNLLIIHFCRLFVGSQTLFGCDLGISLESSY